MLLQTFFFKKESEADAHNDASWEITTFVPKTGFRTKKEEKAEDDGKEVTSTFVSLSTKKPDKKKKDKGNKTEKKYFRPNVLESKAICYLNIIRACTYVCIYFSDRNLR